MHGGAAAVEQVLAAIAALTPGLVNLRRVSELGMRADGEYEVVMADGQRLRMSRRYRKAVLERLESA
jgi:DNA-binding LytR/AlgR family response regulator